MSDKTDSGSQDDFSTPTKRPRVTPDSPDNISVDSSSIDPSSVNDSSILSETSDSDSPVKSRYGRFHKPKSPGDFLSHDKRVSAYMRISPFNQMQYYSVQMEKRKVKTPKRSCDTPSSVSTSDMSDDDVKIDEEQGKSWKIGDLVWAKIGKHPYWPALITADPDSNVNKRHLRKGRHSNLEIHVKFYADSGRRSWVTVTNVLRFEGLPKFFKLQNDMAKTMKNKDYRRSGLFTKSSIIAWWNSAVSEAEEQMKRTPEERVAYFNQTISNEDNSSESTDAGARLKQVKGPKIPEVSKKRKQQSDSDFDNQPVTKKPKLEETKKDPKMEDTFPQPVSPPLRTIADRKKRQATLLELARSCGVISKSPLKPKDAVKETVTEVPKTKKPKPLKDANKSVKNGKKTSKKSKQANDFNFYCSKHFDRTKDDYPDLTEKEIYKRLEKRWNEMDDSQRSRYRARLTVQDSSFQPESGDSNSDAEASGTSENGDNTVEITENVQEPIAAATSKGGVGKRAISLFCGVKAEKACIICEKPGDTLRCRGPCNGYYHLDCIIKKKENPDYKVEDEVEIKKPKSKKGKQDKVTLKNVEEPSTSKNSNLSLAVAGEQTKEFDSFLDGTISLSRSSEEGVEDVPKKLNDETCEKVSEKSKSRKVSKDSDSSEDGEDFRCPDCVEGRTHPCFVCNSYTDPKNNNPKMHRCHTARCGKVYHLDCLKAWPQTTWSSGRRATGKNDGEGVMTCPQHCCHTCVSDNPAVVKARYTNDKIVRCIRCPTSYHYGNYCIPAGSEIITQTQIICPLHYKPPTTRRMTSHVNAAWCFICATGGSLICCDQCPTAFHADCLNISPPDGSYICEDCQTGRFPLYGEIVWVKLGAYRWWPAEILYPAQVPENIQNLPHVRGEFAVRFFGSHDYYWVNRGRVFLLHENDNGSKTNKKRSVDYTYNLAVQEALAAQERLKAEKAVRDAEVRPGMKPPSYVKIKANKVVGSVRTVELNISNMTPCECNPESKNPCAPDSDCLNRLLMVECNPLVCPAGERCNNQCFEKRIYPMLQPFQTESRGWGLKTIENLKKGDFVIEYVGEMIDETEYKKRLARLHATNDENYYFLTIDKDRLLDAGPKGNVSRFMNHSCQPNCETQKWTVNGDTRVGLFALCDIPAGTELVFNYNLETFGNDKKPCMCGAPNCSGFIGSKATKINEDDKKIKSVKKKMKPSAKVSEEECFICHDIGELILCDNKTCPKAYHLECLKKTRKPQGFWVCPWHHCTICNKGRVRRCSVCVNSYCQEHSEGNIRLHEEEGLLCKVHYKEEVSKGNNSAITEDIDKLPFTDSSSGQESNAEISSTEEEHQSNAELKLVEANKISIKESVTDVKKDKHIVIGSEDGDSSINCISQTKIQNNLEKKFIADLRSKDSVLESVEMSAAVGVLDSDGSENHDISEPGLQNILPARELGHVECANKGEPIIVRLDDGNENSDNPTIELNIISSTVINDVHGTPNMSVEDSKNDIISESSQNDIVITSSEGDATNVTSSVQSIDITSTSVHFEGKKVSSSSDDLSLLITSFDDSPKKNSSQECIKTSQSPDTSGKSRTSSDIVQSTTTICDPTSSQLTSLNSFIKTTSESQSLSSVITQDSDINGTKLKEKSLDFSSQSLNSGSILFSPDITKTASEDTGSILNVNSDNNHEVNVEEDYSSIEVSDVTIIHNDNTDKSLYVSADAIGDENSGDGENTTFGGSAADEASPEKDDEANSSKDEHHKQCNDEMESVLEGNIENKSTIEETIDEPMDTSEISFVEEPMYISETISVEESKLQEATSDCCTPNAEFQLDNSDSKSQGENVDSNANKSRVNEMSGLVDDSGNGSEVCERSDLNSVNHSDTVLGESTDKEDCRSRRVKESETEDAKKTLLIENDSTNEQSLENECVPVKESETEDAKKPLLIENSSTNEQSFESECVVNGERK